MIANNSTDCTASLGYDDSNDHVYTYPVEYNEETEDELWMIVDRREWREYLKILWLEVLKLKQHFTSAQYLNCRLYCRKLLIPISGWLARKGYNKKN